MYADIFCIEEKPFLHVVDKAINFKSSKLLADTIAVTFRQSLRMCWIDVQLRPPDFIAHDSVENFMAAAFQSNVDMLRIQTKSIPV